MKCLIRIIRKFLIEHYLKKLEVIDIKLLFDKITEQERIETMMKMERIKMKIDKIKKIFN